MERKKQEEVEAILQGTASQGRTNTSENNNEDIVFFNLRETTGKSFLKGIQSQNK